MAQSLVQSVDLLHHALVSFEPEACSAEDCANLAEKLAALEKVSAAARVRAAARAGACGAHRERGFADVSDWMARATGAAPRYAGKIDPCRLIPPSGGMDNSSAERIWMG